METFYGLCWYLILVHHLDRVWWVWGALLGGLGCSAVCWQWHQQPGSLRECIAPLGIITLGLTLLCLPTSQGLNRKQNQEDTLYRGTFSWFGEFIREVPDTAPVDKPRPSGIKPELSTPQVEKNR